MSVRAWEHCIAGLAAVLAGVALAAEQGPPSLWLLVLGSAALWGLVSFFEG